MKASCRNATGRCAASLLALLLMQEASAERRFTGLGVGRGLDGRIVPALLVDRNGLLWVGSREGLYRYDGYEATAFLPDADDPASISDLDIRALYQSEDGAMWVATNANGVNRRDPGTGGFIRFRHDSTDPRSLSNNSAFSIAQDAGGQVWIGTQYGLNRLDPDAHGFARYFHEPGNAASLSADWVFALHRGPSGQLWIGTVGGGINRWSAASGEFETFSLARLADGPPGLDDVFAIQEMSGGRVWAGTRNGLAILDPATRVVEPFDLIADADVQPLVTAMHVAVEADDDGSLWLSTPLGLSRLDPATGQVESHVPQSGLAVSIRAFDFAVLDFAEVSHEYAYRLDPKDGWTPLGQRRQVTFVGLEPSRYRLEVRGRNVFGQLNTSPALELRVDPTFWMTTAFRASALAGIALLALGLHLARLRALRERNAVLEQLQLQREQALEHATRSRREFEEALTGLRQLTRRLESVKEQERIRISRELHDEFGQTLTAAKLNLQMLRGASEDAAVVRRLDEAVGMVDRMIRQARDIARSLRPPLLDEAGLAAALEDHLKSLGRLSDVRIELDAAPGVANVSPALNTTVFRVIQEAVNNAMRHARATTIRVVLRDEPDAVSIVIEDDGVGFDPEAVGRRIRRGEHLGLLGMTERVGNAGGTIEFDSRPGAGSRIRVRVPHSKATSDTGAASG